MNATNQPRRLSLGACLAAGAAIFAGAGALERFNGRGIWGISGEPGFWSGDINSPHNSQYLFDPYTFSHITHGLLFYALSWMVARRTAVRMRALLVLAVEAAWEVVENTNFVIERYRAATISLHYYGDSVMNSMCDIAACMVGFAVAAILPLRASIVLAIALEVVLGFWIRDGLLLNIVMLIHPFGAIRAWQAGG